MSRTRYDYSSTQVNLPDCLSNAVIQWGYDNVPDLDIYKDPDDPSFGRETEPHVTILYGIYETTAQKIRYMISDEKPFEVLLGTISIFENDNFDVLKISVECKALHDLHDMMKERFAHRKVFPVYSPHVTIAYLKKGRGKKFDGNDAFDGQIFIAKQVAFSGRNGEKCLLSLRGRRP